MMQTNVDGDNLAKVGDFDRRSFVPTFSLPWVKSQRSDIDRCNNADSKLSDPKPITAISLLLDSSPLYFYSEQLTDTHKRLH